MAELHINLENAKLTSEIEFVAKHSQDFMELLCNEGLDVTIHITLQDGENLR